MWQTGDHVYRTGFSSGKAWLYKVVAVHSSKTNPTYDLDIVLDLKEGEAAVIHPSVAEPKFVHESELQAMPLRGLIFNGEELISAQDCETLESFSDWAIKICSAQVVTEIYLNKREVCKVLKGKVVFRCSPPINIHIDLAIAVGWERAKHAEVNLVKEGEK